MEIIVNVTELLKWASGLKGIPKPTRGAIARALNKLGDNVAFNLAEDFASNTDLSHSQVYRLFQIKRANASDLYWELDAEKLLDPTLPSRQLPQRRWERRRPDFAPDLLVNVITAGDVKVDITVEGGGEVTGTRLVEVCEICERKAEEGPYTIAEVRAMAWPGTMQLDMFSFVKPRSPGVTDLFHPNCRCTVWPISRRAKEVTYRPRTVTTRRPGFRAVGPGFQMPEGVGAGTAFGKEFEAITFNEFAKLIGGGK